MTCDPKTNYFTSDFYSEMCGVVSLFFGLCLQQLRPPLRGFVGLVPGFVEVRQFAQRVDGVGMFETELGFAAAVGVEQKRFCFVVVFLGDIRQRQFVRGLKRVWVIGTEFFTLGLTLTHFPEEILCLVVAALLSVEHADMVLGP